MDTNKKGAALTTPKESGTNTATLASHRHSGKDTQRKRLVAIQGKGTEREKRIVNQCLALRSRQGNEGS